MSEIKYVSSHLLGQHRISEQLYVAGVICRHQEGFVVRSARNVSVAALRKARPFVLLHVVLSKI